mmetsp:Transcript_102404/g.330315  ORF Transcript_102404/g.330315 Transcript_102404/m.330315 type:complete len:202 (+) Transcript_102404:528-1133(+)
MKSIVRIQLIGDKSGRYLRWSILRGMQLRKARPMVRPMTKERHPKRTSSSRAVAASTPERQRPRSTEKARPEMMRRRRCTTSSSSSTHTLDSSRSRRSGVCAREGNRNAAASWQQLSVSPAMPTGRKRSRCARQLSSVFTAAASSGPRPTPSVMVKRKRDCCSGRLSTGVKRATCARVSMSRMPEPQPPTTRPTTRPMRSS